MEAETAAWTVLRADFRDTLAAAEGKAALIAMSPPYPDARTCYGSLEWEDYQALGDAVLEALLPGGHCLLNISAPVRQLREGHGTERDLLPFRLLLDWADRVGLTVPDDLCFGRRGFPGTFPGRFRRDHEPLWWFRRPGDPLALHSDRLKKIVKRSGKTPENHTSCVLTDGSIHRRFSASRYPDEVERGTLWDYENVGGHGMGDRDLEAQNHPARWPYRLAADIVACFSDVGDLVVDPFLGGGTTLCAACDGDRRFLGGDLAEEWAEKSRELASRRYAQLSLSTHA